MKILVAESIAEEGISILRGCAEVDTRFKLSPEELISVVSDYDALVVRSQTQVTAEIIEAGKNLQVIGRAGVGIDNVDVTTATRCGIVVVNAPTGNTISAAEHTIALLLSLARHIPQANAALKSGVWKRSEFMGNEVRGKILGIIGLGSIGSEVAQRARGLEMNLIAYDPFISVDHAAKLQVSLVSLEELFPQADFITLHVPMTSSTKGIIGEEELKLVKPTVNIVNTARGGLIDEAAIVRAIKENRVAGAAIDVFPKEPVTSSILFENDNIIVTPHLGASTAEAQTLVARDVAVQIADVLGGKPARYAVNAPFVTPETMSVLAPFMRAVAVTGKLASQLAGGQMKGITISYEGEIAAYNTNILKASILGGVLEEISEERVNLINADIIAANRGLTVVEQKENTCQNYASLFSVQITTSDGTATVAGTVMRGELHIVRINDYWLDIVPSGGYFLFSDHLDRPGLISAVSKVTGDADVNISAMHVGRLQRRGEALMVLALDEALSTEHLNRVLAIPDVRSAKLVRL